YVITGHGPENRWEKVDPKAPSLVCFDKNTGKIFWQDHSPGDRILHGQFASPTIITINGKTQVIAPQGDGWLRSFEPATGKVIWEFNTNSPDAMDNPKPGFLGRRNCLPATAVFHENRLFIGNGHELEQNSGAAWFYCIDPTRTGDISPHVAVKPGQ